MVAAAAAAAAVVWQSPPLTTSKYAAAIRSQRLSLSGELIPRLYIWVQWTFSLKRELVARLMNEIWPSWTFLYFPGRAPQRSKWSLPEVKWFLRSPLWLSEVLPVCRGDSLRVHLCCRNSVEWWLKIMWLGSKRNLLISWKNKIATGWQIIFYSKHLYDGGLCTL